jgi:nicotinamide riboside kinase
LASAINLKNVRVNIALLGAESTGKSKLGKLLALHFKAQGQSVLHIPEYLRTWCDLHKRTPRQEEQLGIATEHSRQINTATTCVHMVADTTPLMIAIYSDLLFGDTSLYDMALRQQRSFDVTLLMGLDIPWVADGIQRDGPHVREPVDAKIRAALVRGGIPYHVVYGSGDARLQHALRCLNSVGATPTNQHLPNKPQKLRNWVCERCSDPECEHRLFQDLLNKA